MWLLHFRSWFGASWQYNSKSWQWQVSMEVQTFSHEQIGEEELEKEKEHVWTCVRNGEKSSAQHVAGMNAARSTLQSKILKLDVLSSQIEEVLVGMVMTSHTLWSHYQMSQFELLIGEDVGSHCTHAHIHVLIKHAGWLFGESGMRLLQATDTGWLSTTLLRYVYICQ